MPIPEGLLPGNRVACTSTMSTPTPLALLGFTAFESQSFQSFFDLGREQGPGYAITDELGRAECAVADADDEDAVSRLVHAGLLERSVLLGSTPRRGAALQLPRPINLLLVMRALDTLVGARPRASASLAPPPPAAANAIAPPAPAASPVARPVSSENQVQRVLDELAFRTAALPSNLDVRALARAGAAQA
jgi:two-component system cell cycle response regulator